MVWPIVLLQYPALGPRTRHATLQDFHGSNPLHRAYLFWLLEKDNPLAQEAFSTIMSSGYKPSGHEVLAWLRKDRIDFVELALRLTCKDCPGLTIEALDAIVEDQSLPDKNRCAALQLLSLWVPRELAFERICTMLDRPAGPNGVNRNDAITKQAHFCLQRDHSERAGELYLQRLQVASQSADSRALIAELELVLAAQRPILEPWERKPPVFDSAQRVKLQKFAEAATAVNGEFQWSACQLAFHCSVAAGNSPRSLNIDWIGEEHFPSLIYGLATRGENESLRAIFQGLRGERRRAFLDAAIRETSTGFNFDRFSGAIQLDDAKALLRDPKIQPLALCRIIPVCTELFRTSRPPFEERNAIIERILAGAQSCEKDTAWAAMIRPRIQSLQKESSSLTND